MPRIQRVEAFARLDGERDYQEALKRANGKPEEHSHEPAAFLTYIRNYLFQAEVIASTDWSPAANARTMDMVRKIGGLCVAAIEEHDCPARVMPAGLLESSLPAPR